MSSSDAFNWHPLTWWSHALDWELHGEWAGGHHLTGVLIHAATAVVLYFALARLTGSPRPSAVVSLVWAVHPLRVESVAWVAERKDVLSGLFFALTLLAYARYAERPGRGRYAAVVLGTALGLLAKPMLVTLPCLLILLDYWPLDRIRAATGLWTSVREKLPLFGFVAVSAMATVSAQQGAMYSKANLPLDVRLTNAVVAYETYVEQLIVPSDLAVFYPHPYLWGDAHPTARVVTSVALVLSATVAAVVLRVSAPWFFVGWFWYLGMLVPVIGLIQVGSQSHADRYTYLPHIGLLIALVWGGRSLAGRLGTPRLTSTAVAALVVALGVLSWRQAGHWRNSESLFRHAAGCTRPNEVTLYRLGLAVHSRGGTDEAVDLFRRALEIYPIDPEIRTAFVSAAVNRGAELAKAGRAREAVGHFRAALDADPDQPAARRNLATAHLSLGLDAARGGRLPEAVAEFRRATEADPSFALAHNNLGVALRDSGRPGEAAEWFRAAIRLDPGNPLPRKNLESVTPPGGR